MGWVLMSERELRRAGPPRTSLSYTRNILLVVQRSCTVRQHSYTLHNPCSTNLSYWPFAGLRPNRTVPAWCAVAPIGMPLCR